MAPRTAPSLPKSLLEEIEGADNNVHGHKRKAGYQHSRKEARKQDRHNRKQRKASYFTHGDLHHVEPATKRSAESEHPDSPQRKKARISASSQSAQPASAIDITEKPSQKKPANDKPAEVKKTQLESKTALEKLAARPAKNSAVAAPLRTQQEEEEDAYIAYLERNLGWTKGGKRTAKYGKGMGDGLDDLLRDLDSFDNIGPTVNGQSDDELSTDEDEEDEEELHEDEENEEESEEDEEAEDEEMAVTDAGEDSCQASPDDNADEWHGFGGTDVEESAADTSPQQDASTAVSAPATAGTRYIPPHLRNRGQEASQASETQLKLTRQMKGLLNRMTELNISSIIDGVEDIYRNHRRHDVTSTLTTLIIDGISAHSILLDSYVVLHAVFLSSLHKLIGVDFAAYFVQHVIASYERHFASLQDLSQEPADATDGLPHVADGEPLGKECSNLIVLLSELYNFQVVSCVLVYDIIRGLLDGALTEFKVELLLKIARNSGQQLRQDDPSALKTIIQIVHSKLPAQANAMSSRTRFMLETLSNLKNNKVKHDVAAGGVAVERMKKFLAGLSKKRHVLAHEPLRVTLEDLHRADSKGKWWLVGAAWGGDPLVEHQESHAEEGKAEPDAPSENALLKLARRQGMNTEIRRGIFVVLMSSEDYVDACERLSQLKLIEVQQREIIRVLLHCCGNEKAYNPYYTLIGQQLCRTSHSHKITLQFCLWDFLRDLGETNVGGAEIIKSLGDEPSGFSVKSISGSRMRHIAKAYGWWIAKDCCTLAILKPIDFAMLKPQTHAFLKELLTQLFISSQVSTPLLSSDPKDFPTSRNRGSLEEVFVKATRMQALIAGLVYFLGEAFRDADAKEDGGFVKWASHVARDTLRTGLDAVANL